MVDRILQRGPAALVTPWPVTPELEVPMPDKRMQPTSAKQLAIELLGAAGEPLRAKELATRIIESGRCSGLKGKTPEATISAMLAVGSKPGGPFKRVEKGTYALADHSSATARPSKQTAQAARPRGGAKPRGRAGRTSKPAR